MKLKEFFGLFKPPKNIKLDIKWESGVVTYEVFAYTTRKAMLQRVDKMLSDNPNEIKEIIIHKIK